MADPVRPLRLSTVVWFGSLEFMSLGFEYDMVLFTPRAPPTDNDVIRRQPRRRRRQGRRPRHTHQARRGRNHPDTAQTQGDVPRLAGIPCPAVGTRSLVGDLSSLSLDKGKMLVECDDAPSSSSTPPLPEETTPAEQSPATAPSPYSFGLRNVAASYAYAYASAHVDPSGHR